MTLPRHLHLGKDESGYFVSSRIIPDFDKITKLVTEQTEISLEETRTLEGPFDAAYVSWEQNLNDDVAVKFQNDKGEYLVMLLDPERKEIVLDRRHSGKTGFHETFAEKIHTLPFAPDDKVSDVRIVLGAPLHYFIGAGYVVVVVQTLFAPRLIVPLAYDSGGVTTSTVTVPLVAALGLGLAESLPGRSPLIDGFGLIAFASLFPMITVMTYAQASEWWAARSGARVAHSEDQLGSGEDRP